MSEEPLVHLMFDIETLGTQVDSVVLSLACVPFSFEIHEYFPEYVKKGFHVKFDVKEQIKVYQRKFYKDTIDWWKTQDKDSRNRAIERSDNDKQLREGIVSLCKFISNTGYSYSKSYIFSRRSHFDFPIIIHLIENSAKYKSPFNSWMIRDTPTYIDIMHGVNNGQYDLQLGSKNEGFIHHYALHDAALEAARLNELYYMAVENPEF